MVKHKKPLKRSLIIGCIIFILLLVALLIPVTYLGFRNALYDRYEAYITDLLRYSSSNIDVDDLENCLKTGEKSQKYQDLQNLFDLIKDTHEIDFIYIIIPLHPGEHDNVMNIIAGMSSYEKEHEPWNSVELGELTGDSYPADAASKYYKSINNTGEITFFEDFAEWGDDYTGVLPLVNSRGEFFAELCVDVAVQDMHQVVMDHVVIDIAMVVVFGLVFTGIFLIWSTHNILRPIKKLEDSIVGFAEQGHGKREVSDLMMKDPGIHTRNELESLSDASMKMATDIRDYVDLIVEKELENERMRNIAREMSKLANKDSLTGVRSKTAYDLMVQEIDTENITDYGIVMVDLNDLKQINDTYGHDAGDFAIKKQCDIICGVFCHSPVFRIGGDEFVVIIRGYDYDNIENLYEKFYNEMEKLEEMDQEMAISAALGYAKFRKGVDSGLQDVFKRADGEMYRVKTAMKEGLL